MNNNQSSTYNNDGANYILIIFLVLTDNNRNMAVVKAFKKMVGYDKELIPFFVEDGLTCL